MYLCRKIFKVSFVLKQRNNTKDAKFKNECNNLYKSNLNDKYFDNKFLEICVYFRVICYYRTANLPISNGQKKIEIKFKFVSLRS